MAKNRKMARTSFGTSGHGTMKRAVSSRPNGDKYTESSKGFEPLAFF